MLVRGKRLTTGCLLCSCVFVRWRPAEQMRSKRFMAAREQFDELQRERELLLAELARLDEAPVPETRSAARFLGGRQ